MRIKHIFGLGLILLMISGAGGQYTNLVTDGELDDWADANNLTNWMNTGSTGTSSRNREAAGVYSGTYCMRVDLDGSGNYRYVRDTAIVLVPGARYVFSFWYKDDLGGGTISKIYMIESKPNNYNLRPDGSWVYGYGYESLPSSAVWTKYEQEFIAYSDTAYQLSVGGRTNPNISVWIDQIKIAACPTQDPIASDTQVYIAGWGAELFTNPTFNVNTAGWSNSNCTIASIAGGVGGENCLEITMVGGTSQDARQSQNLVAGKRYAFTAHVKSGTSGNEAFNFRTSSASSGWLTRATGTSSATWTKYIGEFVAQYSESYVCILSKATATAGTMLFDEATIREVPAREVIR